MNVNNVIINVYHVAKDLIDVTLVKVDICFINRSINVHKIVILDGFYNKKITNVYLVNNLVTDLFAKDMYKIHANVHNVYKVNHFY